MNTHIIIGAGFAGSILAERIASQKNEQVIIIEKRNHIAGNAYDSYDQDGVLIHNYGPHIFHTNQEHVWKYLSQFTDWHLYSHHVLGFIDGKLLPIPFNFNTLYEIFPKQKASYFEKILLEKFNFNAKIPILELRKQKDKDLEFLANFIYEKIFAGYSLKQWGMKPEDLNPTVTNRVPVFLSKDNRYFQDSFQGLPLHGYTRMFHKILNHPNIKIMLNTNYKDVLQINFEKQEVLFCGNKIQGKCIYTGKIDELFSYEFGELPYRSLHFKHKNKKQEFYQKVGTVNFPNNYEFTRITEFKHLTGQKHHSTSIVTEYPQAYERNVAGRDVPYYPIPKPENQALYQKYKKKAGLFSNMILVGRLAEYHYYDMHQIVAKALSVFEKEF